MGGYMRDHFSATTLTPEQAEILEIPEVRVDGVLKSTGRARYTRDFRLPGMLWAKFLMSPYPHARIVSIDASAAKAVPGVHVVLTTDDIGRRRLGRQVADWPVLASERVRYVGERVAAVAAVTLEAAEEAVKQLEVVYEELPAVFDAEDALRPDSPILHLDWEEYYPQGRAPSLRHPNAPSYAFSQKGEEEIERVFANAHIVVEDAYYGPRQHQGYIEPRGCIVWIDEQGTVQVVSTNKTPFSLRDALATIAELPSDRVVVDCRFIGGDFGGKGGSVEEFPCYFLARATGRPIRAIMTYTDELTSANPQHEAKYYLRTAVNREGAIIAHDVRAYQNAGAYVAMRPNPPTSARSGLGCLSPYSIPNVRFEGYNVYTNLVPSGAMRAPGDFHRGHAGEGHIDHIARELGMDPLVFRLRNCLRPGDTLLNGEKVRNPRAVEVLETLRRETNWDQAPRVPHQGRGIALRYRHVGAGKSELLLRLLSDGTIEAITGNADQGGGSHTVIQRAAAATLSVDPKHVRVRFGTTAEALRDPGSGGSRTTTMVGHAAIDGALVLKDKLEDLAAEVMGWPAGDVRLQGGQFVVSSTGECMPYQEVAARIAAGPVVEAVGAYDPAEHRSDEGGDFNFIADMIEVEVDPETGRVHPTQAVAVIDVGTIINPVAHQGQLDGGFIYGLGQAMTEELIHEAGTIITASLGEYKLPTQMDAPRFRTVLLPRAEGPGPFGAKSAGENTNTGVGGAIANAVLDAVGVQITACPITAERVFEALQELTASTVP
ncbi:MAG: molybdopterin-dependent oxidoreductase [Chloroflexi bacterium]|nr:molybdopterin-dependent oxidoreductase [Chloroflexota bacterium]